MIEEILKYRSVSIAGLEKNTGKTESLNYILRALSGRQETVGITSIGVDGESVDALYGTAKPEIELFEGMLFATSEKHYLQRRLISEVVEISDVMTSLGRVVVAKVIHGGKVMISGAADTAGIKRLIDCMAEHGAQTVLVDGALSRLSLSAPGVTQAMILATGAAVSGDINKIAERTQYVCELISLPTHENNVVDEGREVDENCGVRNVCDDGRGVRGVCDEGCEVDESRVVRGVCDESCEVDENRVVRGVCDEGCEVDENRVVRGVCDEGREVDVNRDVRDGKIEDDGFSGQSNKVYEPEVVTGALTDTLLKKLMKDHKRIVVKDFSRIFVTQPLYRRYVNSGGAITVEHGTKLLAVTVNPVSPKGYSFDAKEFLQRIQQVVKCEVYDVKEQSK